MRTVTSCRLSMAVFPAIADEKPREFDNAGVQWASGWRFWQRSPACGSATGSASDRAPGQQPAGQEAFHRHSQEQGITFADQVVLNCLGTLIAFHFTDEISGTQFGEDKDRAIAPGFTDGVLTFQDNVDSMDPGPLFSEGYPVLSG